MRFSERAFRWLLRLYPRSFRAEYGEPMCQLFRDQLRCGPALPRLWWRTAKDFARTIPAAYWDERRLHPMNLLAYVFCLAAMVFIGRFELRTDDTGVVVGFVLIMTAILGALSPKRAWRWSLAGWCVPLAELIWGMTNPNIGGLWGLLAIAAFLTVIGLAGAYTGAFLRRAVLGQKSSQA